MLKQISTLLLCMTIAIVSLGQAKSAERYYFWTTDWRSTTNADSAAYMSELRRISDTCWQMDTWHYSGPMVSSEQFRDESATTPNGDQAFYHASGYLDSTGQMTNGLANGDWGYADDSGRIIIKKHFDMGHVINVDSVRHSDTTNLLNDGETESSFPGGLRAWQKYLLRKIKYPDRALKLGIKGQVGIQFVVNTTGEIENPAIFKSVEYSLDKLTLTIIRESPRWIPATKNGSKVKSYKKQPLVYRF